MLVSCSGIASEGLGDYVIGVAVDEGTRPGCSSAAIRMLQWVGFSVRRIEAGDVNDGLIGDLAAFYFPGGDSPPYIEKIILAGKARLRDAIARGVAYIGTCARAMSVTFRR